MQHSYRNKICEAFLFYYLSVILDMEVFSFSMNSWCSWKLYETSMSSKKKVISEKILAIKADTYNLKQSLCIGSLDSKHCSYVLWDNTSLTRRCNNSSVGTYFPNGVELSFR